MLLAFGVVCGILEARALGAGPGRRRGDGRRRRAADDDVPRRCAPSACGRRARHEPARRRRAVLRGLRCGRRHVAVGAIEPHSTRAARAARDPGREFASTWDRQRWPECARRAAIFAERTRAEWAARFEGATPVSRRCSVSTRPPSTRTCEHEARSSRRWRAKPAAAPRFSRTAPEARQAEHDADAALSAGGSAPTCARVYAKQAPLRRAQVATAEAISPTTACLRFNCVLQELQLSRLG